MRSLKQYGLVVVSLVTLLLTVQPVLAADENALAKESGAYCLSTAPNRPTPPQVVIDKVNEACKLLSSEGEAAFPKFKGKDSPFLYEGTYIWVHRLEDSFMLMHPIKPGMEGKSWIALKSPKDGKRIFVAFNHVAKTYGSGWVEYYWPKPGTNEIVRKISYLKGCKMPDGTDIVIGSGLYTYDDKDLEGIKIY